MASGFEVAVGVGVIWSLAYFRAKLPIWAATLAVLWWYLAGANPWLTVLGYLLLIAVFTPLLVPNIRRHYLIQPIFHLFARILPSVSQTEREALEAGTVWWDAQLFTGAPDWEQLLDYPKPVLSRDEQAFLDGPVEELCRRIDDWQITEELRDLPPELWTFIKENGFFGLIIPKQYGGLGFSALANSAVVMKIASRSITTAVTVMVPNSLGPAELLLHYGSKEQKEHYLPRLASGEEIPAFALTGPEAGSDAAAMPDTGIVCKGSYQGKEVLGIRLNWRKRYITLGPVATVLGLAFKLYDPEHLLGNNEDLGITCALIPTQTEGVSIGRRHFPLNLAFQNGPNEGKDVFIPIDFIIGGPAQAGKGWGMLMESLAAGRGISLPALSTGGGKLVSQAVGAYARVREQFKLPIGRFEGVEEVLARIAGYTYSMDAARALTCGAIDQGEKPSVITAIIKYHLTERMRQVVNDGMDILGGSGISMGPSNFLGRIYQAIPISITVEGANILTRNLIIYGQGAIRCHPYVLKEMDAAARIDQGDAALHDFDIAFRGHVVHVLSNVARALFLGLTGAYFVRAPSGPGRRYFQRLSRMSSALTLASDTAMAVLGGSLKRRERLSARLGDVLSQLYLASAVLKRFEDEGRKAADIPLMQWACEEHLFQMQESLDKFLRNFPVKPIAWVLRLLIFPLGRHSAGPNDRLLQKVAGLLLAPSPSRERLIQGIFTPLADHEALAVLEQAMAQVIETEELGKRLRTAVKAGELEAADEEQLIRDAEAKAIINSDEAAALLKARELRLQVIAVDDFSAQLK